MIELQWLRYFNLNWIPRRMRGTQVKRNHTANCTGGRARCAEDVIRKQASFAYACTTSFIKPAVAVLCDRVWMNTRCSNSSTSGRDRFEHRHLNPSCRLRHNTSLWFAWDIVSPTNRWKPRCKGSSKDARGKFQPFYRWWMFGRSMFPRTTFEPCLWLSLL